MSRATLQLCLAALIATSLSACMARVDGRSALANLQDSAARERIESLYNSPKCQQQFADDDAECWNRQQDGMVVVETGITRSLVGYALSPYTVQTHLKVRIIGKSANEVFYFADAGEGGLEQRDGFGVADGHVNVFCRTGNDRLDLGEYDNAEVDQKVVDASVSCVHEAVLHAGPHFADAVERCVSSFRHNEETQVAAR